MVKRNKIGKKRNRYGGEQGGGPISLVRNPKEMVFTTEMHAFLRTTDMSTPGVFAGDYIAMSSFPKATAFLNVFDQYRIMDATVEFIPQCVTSFIAAGTVATVAPTNVYNHNILTTCIDTDDVNAPANENTILTHESAVVHGPFIRPYKRSFVPAVAHEVYQTGGFGGYANRTHQWCDAASNAIQHYGIKHGLIRGTTAPTGTVTYSIYLHITVQGRKVY